MISGLPFANVRVVLHEHNMGKGAALRTGFGQALGEIVIIQDADLEYDPNDYVVLVQPFIDLDADVVYGSRFLGQHEFPSKANYLGNRFLTYLTNLLFGSELTDMETCYKAFRRDILLSLPLTANRFEFEPEVTGLLLRLGHTISEVPISYRGRTVQEGKKISWRDGIDAMRTLIQCRFDSNLKFDANSR
jgi:glycosyltransferase involved in cell wall biosynthesis